MKLSSREIATVLAALRMFQRVYGSNSEQAVADWNDHFHDDQPLSGGEIDRLCERINFGSVV